MTTDGDGSGQSGHADGTMDGNAEAGLASSPRTGSNAIASILSLLPVPYAPPPAY